MKVLFVSVLSCVASIAWAQLPADSLAFYYSSEGQITCRVIYNSYSEISPKGKEQLRNEYFYCIKGNYPSDKAALVFVPERKKRVSKQNEGIVWDVLKFDSLACQIQRRVPDDSLSMFYKVPPLLESTTRKIFQHIETENWKFVIKLVDQGCVDTHYSNFEISYPNGKVHFRNINNLFVYDLGRKSKNQRLLLVSNRFCMHELIVLLVECHISKTID